MEPNDFHFLTILNDDFLAQIFGAAKAVPFYWVFNKYCGHPYNIYCGVTYNNFVV